MIYTLRRVIISARVSGSQGDQEEGDIDIGESDSTSQGQHQPV